MKWIISFSRDADKFLVRNHFDHREIFELVGAVIKKFQGEVTNVDIRKLKGKWLGFYRIRRGDLRVIASFNFDSNNIFVDQIDWRGNAYKE